MLACSAMIGGSGNDTLVAGLHGDTMIGGSGADLFTFSGGTNNQPPGQQFLPFPLPPVHFAISAEIDNFSANDKVQLQGYGPDAIAFALSHAVIAAGSTTVTLPDHTTILFQGITNMTAAAFV